MKKSARAEKILCNEFYFSVFNLISGALKGFCFSE